MAKILIQRDGCSSEPFLEATPDQNPESACLETKLSELIQLIMSGQIIKNERFVFEDGEKLSLNTFDSQCLLAYVNPKTGGLDCTRSQKKRCLIYILRVHNKNQELISEQVFIKDEKTGKFYKHVPRFTSGEYDLSSVAPKELVCYDTGSAHPTKIKTQEEPMQTVPIQEPVQARVLPPLPKEEKKYSLSQNEEARSRFDSAVYFFKYKKNFSAAESHFIRALETDDIYILQKANYYLGRINNSFKKPIMAAKYLLQSLAYSNNDYFVFYELAKSMIAQNNLDEAESYLARCQALNTGNVGHIIEKAKLYVRQHDYEKAFIQFDMIPNNYNLLCEKAKLLFELGYYDEAKSVLRRCGQLCPSSVKHQLIQGKIAYLDGETAKAEELFEKCIEYDLEQNNYHNIIEIGYFFHQMGNEHLTYKYYQKVSKFQGWLQLSDAAIECHLKEHISNDNGEVNHSVFNFPISLDLFEGLIQDMEMTSTKKLLDVYQIHCENAGYILGEDGRKRQQDYITILTLPFTKKVMVCYSDDAVPGANISWSITLNELLDYIPPEQSDNYPEVQITIDVEDELDSQMAIYQEEDEQNFPSPAFAEFNERKKEIETLIDQLLDDPEEKLVMRMYLGLYQDQALTEKQIAMHFGIEEVEVHATIQRARDNIIKRTSIAMSDVPSIKNQLLLILEPTKN